MSVEPKKKDKVNLEVNYLKIGDKVYGVSEIQAKGIDVNAELKEFYEQRHGQLADEFGEVLNQGMNDEWNNQIAHLRKFDDRGSLKVPNNMFNKLLIVFSGKLLPARTIIYSPNEVECTKAWIQSNCGSVINFESDMWTPFTRSDNFTLKITCEFAIPLTLCFDAKADRMYTPHFKTFHTM